MFEAQSKLMHVYMQLNMFMLELKLHQLYIQRAHVCGFVIASLLLPLFLHSGTLSLTRLRPLPLKCPTWSALAATRGTGPTPGTYIHAQLHVATNRHIAAALFAACKCHHLTSSVYKSHSSFTIITKLLMLISFVQMSATYI